VTAGIAPPPGHKPHVNDTRCEEPGCTELARSFWVPWCNRHRPHTQLEFVEVTGRVDVGSKP
jgi:hypothetical protein